MKTYLVMGETTMSNRFATELLANGTMVRVTDRKTAAMRMWGRAYDNGISPVSHYSEISEEETAAVAAAFGLTGGHVVTWWV